MDVNVVTIVLGTCLLAAIVAVPVWKISARIFFKGGVKNKLKNVSVNGDYTGRDKKN
ncbi:hypothetical protein NFK08_02430 [Enterobacter roggenkampii]|uniref:hypothetical protein n=1 Tax=Enterobacter cloacae complex TaxID=354276 RepID=UPI00163AA320|nr:MULTISPECIES: hypothetical protein [Enterobacter cloacae complex]MCK6942905.1 hypothetical protein [Enterobacter roggenkampii]WFX58921.1 hypothetical protein NFK08_02430 [Enterobacter roggenkampii]